MPRRKIPVADEGFNTAGKKAWFKFYPESWKSDAGVGACSPAARCLWIELLLLMNEAQPRGYLLLAGEDKPPTPDQLAPLVRMPAEIVHTAFAELERRKVFSRDQLGIPLSRKMVRESRVSKRQGQNSASRWGVERPRVIQGGISQTPSDNPSEGRSQTATQIDPQESRVLREEEDPRVLGGSGGIGIARRPPGVTPQIRRIAQQIWDACPPIPRQRCGEVAKIEFTLRDAVKRGDDPALIGEMLVSYYSEERQRRDDGKWAFSPNTGIADGRWRGDDTEDGLEESVAPRPGAAAAPGRLQANGKPEEFGEGAAIVYLGDVPLARPEGGSTHVRGTVECPGPARQLEWLRAWQNGPASWRLEWGPTPGEEGCKIWVSMQQAWDRDQAAQAEANKDRVARIKAEDEARRAAKKGVQA